MIAHYYFEEWEDGYFSCLVREGFEHFVLGGFGETKELALADLRVSYDETRDIAYEKGWEFPELEFIEEEGHYDESEN